MYVRGDDRKQSTAYIYIFCGGWSVYIKHVVDEHAPPTWCFIDSSFSTSQVKLVTYFMCDETKKMLSYPPCFMFTTICHAHKVWATINVFLLKAELGSVPVVTLICVLMKHHKIRLNAALV